MSYLTDFPRTKEYDEDLGWLIDEYHKLSERMKNMEDCCTDVQDQLSTINDWIKNFNDDYIKQIVSEYLATAIFVTISDAGYIIYHIPFSWKNVDFKTTGLDVSIPIEPEYGHLVLYY